MNENLNFRGIRRKSKKNMEKFMIYKLIFLDYGYKGWILYLYYNIFFCLYLEKKIVVFVVMFFVKNWGIIIWVIGNI